MSTAEDAMSLGSSTDSLPPEAPDYSREALSEKQSHLLDLVSQLKGIQLHPRYSRPWLIICGDVPRARNTILEALLKWEFPIRDPRVGHFPMELTMSIAPEPQVPKAELVPDPARGHDNVASLKRAFVEELEDQNFDLTTVYRLAERKLDHDRRQATYGSDILRISLAGPKLADLVVVDMPPVSELQFQYFGDNHHYILALVRSTLPYDDGNWAHVWARLSDPYGKRTIPILVDSQTNEQTAVEVRKGRMPMRGDTKLPELWYHDLRTSRSLVGFESGLVSADEITFYAAHEGVSALISRAMILLHGSADWTTNDLSEQCDKWLRSLSKDIRALPPRVKDVTEETLRNMGARFDHLVVQGSKGHYEDNFFKREGVRGPQGKPNHRVYLRQEVEALIEQFVSDMREKGEEIKVVEDDDFIEEGFNDEIRAHVVHRETYLTDIVDRAKHMGEVPAQFELTLASELFIERVAKWSKLGERLVENVYELVQGSLHDMLLEAFQFVDHRATKKYTEAVWNILVEPGLAQLKTGLSRAVSAQTLPYRRKSTWNFDSGVLDGVPGACKTEIRRILVGQLPLLHQGLSEPVWLYAFTEQLDMQRVAAVGICHTVDEQYKISMEKFIEIFEVSTFDVYMLNELYGLISPQVLDAGLQEIMTELRAITLEVNMKKTGLMVRRDKLINVIAGIRRLLGRDEGEGVDVPAPSTSTTPTRPETRHTSPELDVQHPWTLNLTDSDDDGDDGIGGEIGEAADDNEDYEIDDLDA